MLDTVVILVHPATRNALDQVNLTSRFTLVGEVCYTYDVCTQLIIKGRVSK